MNKERLLAFCVVLTIVVSITWLLSGLGPYLQSASANCEDNVVQRTDIAEEFTAIWVRRNCGMLYGGGPYTVLRLKQKKFFGYLGAKVDVIEVEDEHGNFMPRIALNDGELLLSGVPSYARFMLVGEVFGLKVDLMVENDAENTYRR